MLGVCRHIDSHIHAHRNCIVINPQCNQYSHRGRSRPQWQPFIAHMHTYARAHTAYRHTFATAKILHTIVMIGVQFTRSLMLSRRLECPCSFMHGQLFSVPFRVPFHCSLRVFSLSRMLEEKTTPHPLDTMFADGHPDTQTDGPAVLRCLSALFICPTGTAEHNANA